MSDRQELPTGVEPTHVDREQPAQDVCESCGGDGKETCDNPDHGFINSVGGETQRLGCPVCGHDEDHKTGEPCPDCKGTGFRQPAQDGGEGFDAWRKRVGDMTEPAGNFSPIVSVMSELSAMKLVSDALDHQSKQIERLRGELETAHRSIQRWGEMVGDPIGGDYGVLDSALNESISERDALTAERDGYKAALEFIRDRPSAVGAPKHYAKQALAKG